MHKQALEQRLTEHAQGFHRALLDGGVYHTPLSEAAFLDRARPQIAQAAHDVEQGRQELDFMLLSLPVSLMYELRDVIATAWWDYEFGFEHLCAELARMFEPTPYAFEWTYDQDRTTLTYTLDSRTWTIADIALDDEVQLQIVELDNNLDGVLRQQGRQLYAAETGDQTQLTLVVPVAAAKALSAYLITGDDPRRAQFHNF